MQDASVSRYASMLGALSQPTRLKIVEVVASGAAEGTPAGEIARAVHCPASTLSFHLKELAQAGLLAAEPQGRFIRYRVVHAAFQSLSDFVRDLPGTRQRAQQVPSPRLGRKGRRKTPGPGAAQEEGQLSIFEE
jgi:DNA-binding transcriptional ArsR family regulator